MRNRNVVVGVEGLDTRAVPTAVVEPPMVYPVTPPPPTYPSYEYIMEITLAPVPIYTVAVPRPLPPPNVFLD